MHRDDLNRNLKTKKEVRHPLYVLRAPCRHPDRWVRETVNKPSRGSFQGWDGTDSGNPHHNWRVLTKLIIAGRN